MIGWLTGAGLIVRQIHDDVSFKGEIVVTVKTHNPLRSWAIHAALWLLHWAAGLENIQIIDYMPGTITTETKQP